MSRTVYLVGGGGHGGVVLDTMLSAGITVAGIIDPDMVRGESLFGIAVLGGDEVLASIDPEGVVLANGLGANPRVGPRRSLFETLGLRGFQFMTVQHPSAVVGRECIFEAGAQVMAGTVLQCRVRVGANAVINTRASIDHDSTIGAHAFVSPGAVLCGSVTVGEAAFIGAGAIVLPGIRVGDGSIIGAGALVTRLVPERAQVIGNPARRAGATA